MCAVYRLSKKSLRTEPMHDMASPSGPFKEKFKTEKYTRNVRTRVPTSDPSISLFWQPNIYFQTCIQPCIFSMKRSRTETSMHRKAQSRVQFVHLFFHGLRTGKQQVVGHFESKKNRREKKHISHNIATTMQQQCNNNATTMQQKCNNNLAPTSFVGALGHHLLSALFFGRIHHFDLFVFNQST